MPVRLGIELSSTACRIVELGSTARARHAPDTRLRSVARLPRDSAETRHRLAALGNQPAAVVAWGLQADHRQVIVQRGSSAWMRREAVAMMQGADVSTRGRVADVFVAPREKGATTRAVVVALASTAGVMAVLRRLVGEGLQVQSIVTPALALMSLARLRPASVSPDRIEAYVALEETETALALVRKGQLVAGAELRWGYQDERGFNWTRDELATRLAEEIVRCLAAYGARRDSLAQVCICGGLPELRSMAVRLTEQLDVEVEPLDSLFGVDPQRLPASADELREHAAEFRLAWAVAADRLAPLNLLRGRRRRTARTVLSRAAVAAGVVTGVGVAWQLARSDGWGSTPVSSLSGERSDRLPQRAERASGPPNEPPAVRAPIVEPPSLRPIEVSPNAAQAREAPRPAAAPRPRAVEPEEVPLPFDAALGTILYASERRLAIVDGRIIQTGDDVNGARVIDITPTSVLLRDGRGRLRQLDIEAPPR